MLYFPFPLFYLQIIAADGYYLLKDNSIWLRVKREEGIYNFKFSYLDRRCRSQRCKTVDG